MAKPAKSSAIKSASPARSKCFGTMDFALLKKYGIPVAEFALARNEKDAISTAKKIKYPVAMKLISASVLHKTEKNAISLDIRDEKTLASEFSRLLSIDRSGAILVQKYLKGKVELIIGGRIDPQFGQIVLFGLGGIYVEIMKDRALRVCPIEEEDALSMIRELKSYPILAGARGGKIANEDALAKIIVAASKLMQKEKPSELDINPLVWTGDGFIAADVRVIR